MREPGHERLIGRTIAGKFVVEELLGAGAMGAVYRARQIALEKTVAIKVLHGEHAHDATFAARFHREAKAASRLNHPNSMQVVDFGAEPDGLLYIAMEYLDGRSLHRVLREEWPLAAARIADILMQALAALAVAHDMGVVHRDLKPENIMVLPSTDDDGRPKDLVKVCDFGIAKMTDSRAYRGSERESNGPVTTAGFLVGTPEYMSPEQGRGDKLDARSDIYSVGVVLFEMLTRRVPFEAENAIGVVLRHLTEVPPRPSDLAPGVDLRLEAICLRALRKAPAERYGSAREMRAEMRPVVVESTTSTIAAGTSAAQLATGIAPTVEMPAAAQTAHFSDDGARKPTLLGTTTTIPGAPARRALVVASAALFGSAVVATTLAMIRSHPHAPAAPAAHGSATEPTQATPITAPQTATTGVDLVHAALPPSGAAEAHLATPHGKPTPGPGTVARAVPTTSATVVAPGAASALAPLPAQSAATAPTASTRWIQAPLLPTSRQGPPAATETPDPNFDPERAYVEVGLINAQGVREPAVRAALRGIGLARCYRAALRARGARATGMATLNLSFDETGLARSAIVTGAEFLPGLSRCLQSASGGMRVQRSNVDPSGATAEIILAFKGP
jgi:serine/threonine-protein kinase